jgi:hypothetical protein
MRDNNGNIREIIITILKRNQKMKNQNLCPSLFFTLVSKPFNGFKEEKHKMKFIN